MQTSRDRDAIYQLSNRRFRNRRLAWALEGRAVNRAHRALHLRGHSSVREPEPFAAVIYCTADRDKADERTRSKWSRVLRYAAEYKDLDEPLRDFIKRKGGINKCAARFARRQLRRKRGCRIVRCTLFRAVKLTSQFRRQTRSGATRHGL